MNKAPIHYRMLAASMALCLFMYVDAYWIPSKAGEEITLSIRDFESRSKSSRSHTYVLTTDARTYDITEPLYRVISIGDKVIIERSRLTGAPQKASLSRGEYIYTYEIGFLRARSGLLFAPVILLGSFAFIVFYKRLDNLQERSNMTCFLFTASLILFLFHLDLSFF